MKAVILAAGLGSRLGGICPKPLRELANGLTIMEMQMGNLLRVFDIHSIIAVVGYKKEMIIERFPDLLYVCNPNYAKENTAKSLLRALRKVEDEDVLWLNGDVVFEEDVLQRILSCGNTSMAVNVGTVGKEEVKYTLYPDGTVRRVSKVITNGLGESLGIHFVKKESLRLLKSQLEICMNTDYFEKALESSIDKGLRVHPVDVSDLKCVEIDFEEDLWLANRMFTNQDVSVYSTYENASSN